MKKVVILFKSTKASNMINHLPSLKNVTSLSQDAHISEVRKLGVENIKMSDKFAIAEACFGKDFDGNHSQLTDDVLYNVRMRDIKNFIEDIGGEVIGTQITEFF